MPGIQWHRQLFQPDDPWNVVRGSVDNPLNIQRPLTTTDPPYQGVSCTAIMTDGTEDDYVTMPGSGGFSYQYSQQGKYEKVNITFGAPPLSHMNVSYLRFFMTGNPDSVFPVGLKGGIPPLIKEMLLNGELDIQRSMIKDMSINFDKAVTFPSGAASAFIVKRLGASNPETIVSAQMLSGNTGVKLFFNGLPNGFYDITLPKNNVIDGSSNNMPFDWKANTYRLFGDANRDGTVDNADFYAFQQAYGKSSGQPGYQWYFDEDSSGTIDNADLFKFNQNMNKDYYDPMFQQP